jgi:protease-4
MARNAARPLRALGSGVHRGWLGSSALVEVDVQGIAGLRDRHRWLDRLRRLGHDPSVVAVLLRVHEGLAGWAALQDLLEALGALRAAGKRVYAYSEVPGNAAVAIAAAADRSYVLPTGDVGLVGVGAELTFFGSLLERLGVEPDFEAAGAYKSFGEPFTRSFASPANLEAMQHLIGDMQRQLVQIIASGRNLAESSVEELFARAPLSAAEAVAAGLFDQLAYEDQVFDHLEEAHGASCKRVPFDQWAKLDAARQWVDTWGRGTEKIAVLHLDGPIAMDRPHTGVGAKQVVPLLQQLEDDDDVAAVVLHVASPGGSAVASDLMWRRVDQLRRAKPVVACFEDVAASGGFYLSAPAQQIVARPGTLTGSRGVFGGTLVVGEGLRKAGVHTQAVLGAPHAAMYTASRPFTDAQRKRFRASLQRMYDGFVSRVAEGRGRSEDELEPHCRGRVWTGRAAKERGLVDHEGGLLDAIERARALASLPHLPVVHTSPHDGFDPARFVRNQLSHALPGAARAALTAMPLDPSAELLLTHTGQPLALLPYGMPKP